MPKPEQLRFLTHQGVGVPAVTGPQMREVDRIAMEVFHLGILQMMENAGKSLAWNALEMLAPQGESVLVLAGPGGNGGGGLCCVRHLRNRGCHVGVVTDRPPQELEGAAADQWSILAQAGVTPLSQDDLDAAFDSTSLIVDALLGYSLQGPPRGRIAELIERCSRTGKPVLSLDLPSGMEATTGAAPGVVVKPDRVLTLALPKTGLIRTSADLYLADIGIPAEVYEELGIQVDPLFAAGDWIPLHTG